MLERVFISYRHKTAEHARAVRRLGELLRQAKIPVALDQYYSEEHPGGPDSGSWPKWSEDGANESACVLVKLPGWFDAYDKIAAGAVGLRAATEADVLRQWLYEEKGDNTHIRIAFLHEIADEKVPRRLRAWHHFRPFSNEEQSDMLIAGSKAASV